MAEIVDSRKRNGPRRRRLGFSMVVGIVLALFFSLWNIGGGLSDYAVIEDWSSFISLNGTMSSLESMAASFDSMLSNPRIVDGTNRVTIAYAISLTDCREDKISLMQDGAAVLHQSIRLVSRESKYDYTMIAFVHPGALHCAGILQWLGYEIQFRETPFNETAVTNQQLIKSQGSSCCGFKEYLKLYSYVQFEYPVVVHLDLDCLVLKPLDDVFDLMLDPTFDRSRIPAMWKTPQEIPDQVDFVFTRDYGMIQPGHRQPHQVGVQGGFLVVRPNQTDFDRLVEIIIRGGDFSIGRGWGGDLNYGGYYGAGTIQGLASYYYGEFATERALELNRCYYDQMVDNPYGTTKATFDKCVTSEVNCQDCRKTKIQDVFLTHFTNCGKPFKCMDPSSQPLCVDLHREWHLVRLSLEVEWARRFPDYNMEFASYPSSHLGALFLNISQGHCAGLGKYKPISYPTTDGTSYLLPRGNIPLFESPHSVVPSNTTLSTGGRPSGSVTEDDKGQNPGKRRSYRPEFKNTSMPANIESQMTPVSVESSTSNSQKITVGYAVSLTGCNQKKKSSLLDGAAVLKYSIHVASQSSKYGYEMIAFVHPDAKECAPYLEKLDYQVRMFDTPFNETQVSNVDLIRGQGASCCGFKEYLKLYAYLETQYQIVVHLDLDYIVLRPFDDVFDLMLDPAFDRSKIDAMWLESEDFPDRVDFLFTRDYNMVDPPTRQPHQIGVQGGFMIFRPNATDFQRNIDIIRSKDSFRGAIWGGHSLGYGGYYGAATIQGLASYYYGEFAKNRSLELNRCYYNTMVDNPMGKNRKTGEMSCRTLENECQDCRQVNITAIYSSHFTVCGKPWTCQEHPIRLCQELRSEWHHLRMQLENDWMHAYPGYSPLGSRYCAYHNGKKIYSPLHFPVQMNLTEDGD